MSRLQPSLLLNLFALFLLLSGCRQAPPPPKPRISGASVPLRVRQESKELLEIVPTGIKLEQLATGFVFIEGPVWVSSPEPTLLFSDLRGNALYRWSADTGVSAIEKPFNQQTEGRNIGPNGLALDPAGRLVVCDSGNRRIVRFDPNGRPAILADNYEGMRLNSPNDLVFSANGTLYFTDPPYGLPREDRDPAKELHFNGVYRLLPDGTLEVLSRDQTRPNGVALSPDQRTLYVSNSDPEESSLLAFDLSSNSGLGAGRRLFEFRVGSQSAPPDGIKVDRTGRILVAAGTGIWILDPAGKLLGVLELDEPPSNLGWGDPGGMLYITASTSLYRIQLQTVGFEPLTPRGG